MIPDKDIFMRGEKKYDKMAETNYGNIQRELLPY